MNKREEYAIEVDNVYLRYPIFNKMSLPEMLASRTLRLKKKQDFEALKNVSFKIEKGKIVGIIGKNGSGKSTLLSTIAGIFAPDAGTIDLHDHTVSLLSIGTGFNAEMSGRENILLSGMLLGYEREQILELMDSIIEFADIGEFIDYPVRKYSSGMYSKLAFSVSVTLKTDIMLVDEVLSVGDENFKKKSYAKMQELIGEDNRTVLIVSHSLPVLLELCDTILWLHHGEIVKMGDPETIVQEYKAFMDTR